jgi:hypothetical protein
MAWHSFTDVLSRILHCLWFHTKFKRKVESFLSTKECQKAWELIKYKYIETQILILLNWDVEFQVHIDASLLVVGTLLAQNIIGKSDQLIVYVFKLLNNVKQNYNTTKRETLAVIFTLHNFRHYLLGIHFFFI